MLILLFLIRPAARTDFDLMGSNLAIVACSLLVLTTLIAHLVFRRTDRKATEDRSR